MLWVSKCVFIEKKEKTSAGSMQFIAIMNILKVFRSNFSMKSNVGETYVLFRLLLNKFMCKMIGNDFGSKKNRK